MTPRPWLVDRPLPWLRRTPRELLLFGVAAGTAVQFWRTDPGGAVLFAAVAVAFATRWFATRVLAMGVALAATALWATHLVTPGGRTAHEASTVAYFCLGIALLHSRALIAAFDDRPSRTNFWRHLPPRERRSLAAVMYGVGITGAAAYEAQLAMTRAHHAAPAWMTVAIAWAVLCGLLLVAGRALAGLLAAVGAVAFAAITAIPAARVILAHGELRAGGPLVVTAAAAAVVTAALAAPWAWRLLRHARAT